MTLFKSNVPMPNDPDEFTTQAANAAQLVAAASAALAAEEQDQLGFEGDEPVHDAADEEGCDDRTPPQTREAYLKKGEDLIRSLL